MTTLWVVVCREVLARFRDTGFRISVLVSVVVLLAIVLLPTRTSSGEEPLAVAVTTTDEGRAAALTRAGLEVDLYDDDHATLRALEDGRHRAAVTSDEVVHLAAGTQDGSTARITEAVARAHIGAAVQEAGADPATVARALDFRPEVQRADSDADAAVPTLALFLVFGQLLTYGYWIAASVLEEKSSRTLELLLAAVRPRQLMLGKMIGTGVVALAHTLALGLTALVAARVAGLSIAGAQLSTLGLLVAAFLLGYVAFASLFVAAASLVTRQEELGNVTAPVQLFLVGCLLWAVQALDDPTGLAGTSARLVPFTSPMLMPARIAAGGATWLEVVASAILLVVTCAALLRVAAAAYSGNALRTSSSRNPLLLLARLRTKP